MRWDQFAAACPEIAALAESRFRNDQLVMIGTIRSDGSPRISPCEADFAAGVMALGMMWRSRKALDLLRDSRILVHSITCNKEGTDGDVKLSGRASEVRDPELRKAFRDATYARTGWAPGERSHYFSIDVELAGYIVFGDARRALSWDPRKGATELPFPDAD